MVQFDRQCVYIDGKPQILLGGEIHYFRMQPDDWHDALTKLKNGGLNFVSTYIPWCVHEQTEGVIDFGETNPRYDLAKFLDTAQELGLFVMVRPGPYIMAEIRNDGIPDWVFDHYPQVEAIGRDGAKHPNTIVSYLHPDFIALVKKWYEKLFSILAPRTIQNKGSIISFQLDNEIGMLHWVSKQADFNHSTMARFQNWLNENHCEAIYNWKNDDAFRASICQPKEGTELLSHRYFHSFHRQYFQDYVAELKSIASQYVSDTLFIVNVHGCDKNSTATFPIGLSQLYKTAELADVYLACDYYGGDLNFNNVNDLLFANACTYAMQAKNQPLMSVEFQGGSFSDFYGLQPESYALNARLCLASGMKLINYYMYADGTNPEGFGPHGHSHVWRAPIATTMALRKHYYAIQESGRNILAISDYIGAMQRETSLSMGLVSDYYMTEYATPAVASFEQELKTNRELVLHSGMTQILTANNLAYKGVRLDDSQEIDVQSNPVMMVFCLRYMAKDVQEKIVRYIQKGGKALIFPNIPEFDMDNKPCTVLKDALQIRIHERYQSAYYDKSYIQYENNEILTYMSALLLNNEQNVLATETLSGKAVAIEGALGTGQFIFLGVSYTARFENGATFLLGLLQKLGVETRVQFVADFEERLLVAVNGNEEGHFIFVGNLDEYEKEAIVSYNDRALFGGKKINYPARKILILPYQLAIANGLRIMESTAEIAGIDKQEQYVRIAFHARQQESVLVSAKHVYGLRNCHVIQKNHDTCEVLSNEIGVFEIEINFA